MDAGGEGCVHMDPIFLFFLNFWYAKSSGSASLPNGEIVDSPMASQSCSYKIIFEIIKAGSLAELGYLSKLGLLARKIRQIRQGNSNRKTWNIFLTGRLTSKSTKWPPEENTLACSLWIYNNDLPHKVFIGHCPSENFHINVCVNPYRKACW